MEENWGPKALMVNGRKCEGYSTYPKTILEYNSAEQQKHTLLVNQSWLPDFRRHVAGFKEIEDELIRIISEKFGVVVELFYAHGLRQSPETLRSTGFDVHQDTEDFEFIKYTVVVKLTADEPNEPCSKMAVVGALDDFSYGPEAGASGHFDAELYHMSRKPESEREHLKMAFFFRRCEKGERLALREALPGAARGGRRRRGDDAGPSDDGAAAAAAEAAAAEEAARKEAMAQRSLAMAEQQSRVHGEWERWDNGDGAPGSSSKKQRRA